MLGHGGQDFNHAVLEGLATEKAHLGMLLGLPEEVLAATKANFEPYLTHAGREQTGRVCHLRRAAGNGNARQKLAPEAGLARA
jgi:hypothetical protein